MTGPGDAPRIGVGRLMGKTAVVVGAGQTQGETIGNGRATALLFARHGARLLLAGHYAMLAGALNSFGTQVDGDQPPLGRVEP